MDIRRNYKQTEIGVFPADWVLKDVAKIATINGRVGWKGYTKKDLRDSGPLAIGAKHIDKANRLDLTNPTFLSVEKYFESPEIMVIKGDILIVQRGSIGKVVVINEEIGDATINPSMLILRFKEIPSNYVFYYLISNSGQNQILSDTSSTGVPMITQKQVLRFSIPLPPTKSEQTAIATALSDVDALISSLEKLIEKKWAIKQGAIQKLLTGEKRLDEYSGSWIDRLFPDMCWFQEGPGLRNWQFTSEGIKVINVTNLEEGYLNLDRTSRYISWAEFDKMYKHFEIDADDIVVASSGNSYAKVAVVRKQDLPLVMNTSVIRFKPLKNLDYNFLLAFLKSNYFKDQIDLLITGGAQPNFGPFHLRKIIIKVPPTIEEQKYIGQILIDMDKESEVLDQKLFKYKMIKRGMMLELLTGRIRLI